MREDANPAYVPPAARLGAHELASAAKRSTEIILLMISDHSGDNHLKLHVQPGGDGWSITPWPVSQESHRPLHAEQPTGQFASLQLLWWSRGSALLAFPTSGGRPSSTDLVRLRRQLPVAISSAMTDLMGGARHE